MKKNKCQSKSLNLIPKALGGTWSWEVMWKNGTACSEKARAGTGAEGKSKGNPTDKALEKSDQLPQHGLGTG